MNDCPNGEIRDLLPDLLHQRLAEAERTRVQAHVAGCVDCREELALLDGLRATMRRVPAVDVSAVVQAIPAYLPASRRSWGGWRIAAAVTALAVGGTSIAVVRDVGRAPVAFDSAVVAPVRGAEPSLAVGPGATGAPVVTAGERAPSAAAGKRAGRELAMAGGSIGELSEDELSTLLRDVRTMDVIPSADVELEPSLTPPGVVEP